MQGSQRLDSRTRRTGDHDVGGTSLDDGGCLGDGKAGRCFTHRQTIAGTSKLVVNGNVAGGHVGQVFQQPQWLDLRQPIFGPLIHLKFFLIVHAAQDTAGEFFRPSDDVVTAEQGSDSGRVATVCRQFSIGDRKLRSGDSHLDFSTHQTQPLFDAALHLLF